MSLNSLLHLILMKNNGGSEMSIVGLMEAEGLVILWQIVYLWIQSAQPQWLPLRRTLCRLVERFLAEYCAACLTGQILLLLLLQLQSMFFWNAHEDDGVSESTPAYEKQKDWRIL